LSTNELKSIEVHYSQTSAVCALVSEQVPAIRQGIELDQALILLTIPFCLLCLSRVGEFKENSPPWL